jgi:Mn2+/Fe2+ NRAMP family transporter
MADATKLLIGGPVTAYVLVFGLICVIAQIFVQYARYVRVLKWLSLSLFAYVAALAAVRVPWGRGAQRNTCPDNRVMGWTPPDGICVSR